MAQPRLRTRLEVTNGDGTFDSASPDLSRGDGLDEARIEFDVVRTLDPTPNTGRIAVYNLSQATVDRICGTVRKRLEFSADEKAELEALGASSAPIDVVYDNLGLGSIRLYWGYAGPDALSLGFSGGSTNMTDESDGTTSKLVIQAEDGGQLLGAGRLKRYYKGGTDTVVIIRDLVRACGLTVDEDRLRDAMQRSLLERGIAVGALTQGTGYNAATTPAATQIRAVMDSLGLRWSIQDGEFLVLSPRSVIAGLEPLVLSSADFTLFGNPARLEDQQLQAKTWANAEARPGREVLIAATALETQYRIDTAMTSGDGYEGGVSTLTLDALQVVPGVF